MSWVVTTCSGSLSLQCPPAQPSPDLLADEGREGLHLQGGAHDDKQVHLQEVLRRGNTQEGSRTLRRGWATVPCSPPRAHLKPVGGNDPGCPLT